MAFVSRRMELALLNNLYGRSGAQFLILYGRRRIGKTALIGHWGKELSEPYFYWMASQTSATNQLRNFSQALFQFLHPGTAVNTTFSYSSWDAAFAEVARLASDKRVVVVLDEFTYVMQADPEVPSLLQRAWDHQLKDSQVFLVLMGSLAGIIQRAALDYQSPLYGRATARLKLQPLSFGALSDLLPNYNSEQRVAVYTITGGVPAYLERSPSIFWMTAVSPFRPSSTPRSTAAWPCPSCRPGRITCGSAAARRSSSPFSTTAKGRATPPGGCCRRRRSGRRWSPAA
jgi:uncharacterized protein